MEQAYAHAVKAKELGEVPIGAVIVNDANELLGSGWNQVIKTYNPTAHAEMIAIKAASETIQNYRLVNTTLYVTLEPCCMCAGAMIHSRVKRLVFATRDFKAGAAGSIYNLLQGYPLNHKVLVDEGVLEHECSTLLSGFFKDSRA